MHYGGRQTQFFPFYTYHEDGSNRRENITDWALAQFRDHYGDETISKWDIFYYVYGVLHHPGYREKFADNLKRELPRIPFAPALTPAGAALTLNPSPVGRGTSQTGLHPSPAGEGPGVRATEARLLVSKVMIQVGRELRQRLTDAEQLLWEHVRDRRLGGIKFRRQHPIPESAYVADFYCHESRLVIELDGPIHDQQQKADVIRQQDLEALGYHVLRFSNAQVFNNLESVLTTILTTHHSLLPSPAETALTLNPSPGGRGTSQTAFPPLLRERGRG